MVLDNEKLFNSCDSENIIQYIDDFPNQVELVWRAISNVVLPSYYIKIKNVVVYGMGGSGIAGDMIKSFSDRLKKPVTVIHDYSAAEFIDNETLVIAVSFSGETEETIIAFKEAIKKNGRPFVIGTGGSLIDLAKSADIPYYQFTYASPPRYSIGYTLTALLAIFNKLSILDISNVSINEAILLLRGWAKKLSKEIPQSKNPAKQLAAKLVDRIPVIVSPAKLGGLGIIWKMHLNETAKYASYWEELPNFNHNSISGLNNPKKIIDRLYFLVIQSKYMLNRVKLQENLMLEMLDKHNRDYETVFMHPTNDIYSEMYLNILFAEYVAYYLAVINKTNPSLTPNQDFVKKSLKERN